MTMQQVVYVANPVSGLIHVSPEAGTLAPLQEVQTGGEVQPLVISPTGAGSMQGCAPISGAELPIIAADGRLVPLTSALLLGSASHLHRWERPYLLCRLLRLQPVTVSARIRRAGCNPSPASRPPDGGPLGHPGLRGKTGSRSCWWPA